MIRHEITTRPGELYNRALLMQTISTLNAMGHFNPEAIVYGIRPVSNELVDINPPRSRNGLRPVQHRGRLGFRGFVVQWASR